MRMTLVRTVAPAETPVTVAEAKAQLRVTTAADDTLITALIQAATDHLDGWQGVLQKALVTQTWRLDTDRFPPCRYLDLPLKPVQSVASVKYSDTANAEQTLDPASYVLGDSVLILNSGVSFPSIYDRPDAVRITFVAGYGAAADVPTPIKQAILLMVGQLYSMARSDQLLRSESVEGLGSRTWMDHETAGSALRGAADMLLAPYRPMVV